MAKKKQYVYGQSLSPSNWHEAAAILKASQKPKGNGKDSELERKLSDIHKMLKDRK